MTVRGKSVRVATLQEWEGAELTVRYALSGLSGDCAMAVSRLRLRQWFSP